MSSEPQGVPRSSNGRVATAYALAVVGGFCYFLGWAGFGIWPLAFVAFVPLWAALELGLERRVWHSLALGWVYGTVLVGGGYHWLISFLEVFSGYGIVVSVVIWLLFSVWVGGQIAVVAILYRWLRRAGWSIAVCAIPPILVVEWLYPMLFRNYLANSLYRQIGFIQIADLGGPLLVSAVIALVNVAVFETLRWFRGRRSPPKLLLAGTALAIALTLLYGRVRIEQVTAQLVEAPVLRVGVVQVNMGIFEKRNEAEEGHRRHLEQSRALENEGELDLLIWPESAYIGRLPRSLPLSGRRVRRDLTTPILFGSVSVEQDGERRKMYNTAFLIDADGMIRGGYDKTYLLAFGEYLPFGETFPVLYELSPNSGRFTRGAHVRPIEFGRWRLSTPICYEDILPAFTREMVLEGDPHILINLTNDSWFGDTQEPWIHLAMSQLRAIEHRRYLIRSTNSGVSAVVDPLGRIVANTGVMTRESLRYDVRMLEGKTLYTRFGDWPGWLSSVAIALMLLIRRSR